MPEGELEKGLQPCSSWSGTEESKAHRREGAQLKGRIVTVAWEAQVWGHPGGVVRAESLQIFRGKQKELASWVLKDLNS